MKLALTRKSDRATDHANTRMNAIESSMGSCGIILIACDIENKQLRILKKFLIKESGLSQPRLLYDVSGQVITVIFEGMTLSTTHWFGLAVKSFMKNKFGLEQGVLIASFLQGEYPQSNEIEAMIGQLNNETDENDSLIVYKSQSRLPDKERSVLIIDDDIVAGDFLKVQLESIGYEVHQAFDGVQGVSSFDELNPDVVIMELNLPALDGFQVIRHIQSNDGLDSQIIVLSEQRLDKDIEDCLNLGVTEYMTKPYSPLHLEQVLNKVWDESIHEVI